MQHELYEYYPSEMNVFERTLMVKLSRHIDYDHLIFPPPPASFDHLPFSVAHRHFFSSLWCYDTYAIRGTHRLRLA